MSKDDKLTRKLSAILSADVKAYSLLMADDEVHTIETLKNYRQIISDLVSKHSGRVVDSPGDNILAEFGSAVDAVSCAVQIQNRLQKENAKFVEYMRLLFRIGVNIGDVVHDDGRIYGSGVNVAARIEGIADPGGICISRNTYDQIKDKLNLEFEYLGEHEVHNIEEPVRVYRVLMESESSKPSAEVKLELPDKPSIAVLPFDNMSGDPEQEYFSDGITEDIITALSRSALLFVISRISSFTYRDSALDVRRISSELGVRYILEGSVRKAGERIRVTAQLIDGINGSHVWAEKYDGELQDIFDLQDNITQQVVASVQTQIHLSVGEGVSNVERPDVATWDLLARGIKLYLELTKESLNLAEDLFRKAIESAPESGEAYYFLAGVLIHQVFLGYSSDESITTNEALDLAKRAITLSNNHDFAHWTLGIIHSVLGNYELAIAEYKRSIEINPNLSLGYGSLGSVLSGIDPDESIKCSEIAIRTNPRDPSIFFRYSAMARAHFVAGRYLEATQWARRSIQSNPNFRDGHAFLAASLALLNNLDEAKEAVRNYKKTNPDEKISDIRKYVFFRESDPNRRLEEGLRKAGMYE